MPCTDAGHEGEKPDALHAVHPGRHTWTGGGRSDELKLGGSELAAAGAGAEADAAVLVKEGFEAVMTGHLRVSDGALGRQVAAGMSPPDPYLKDAKVKISMDGKRRWIDNVMVERLWRSLKYEDIYSREYLDLAHLDCGVGTWLDFYNHERCHKALAHMTPWEVWQGGVQKQAA